MPQDAATVATTPSELGRTYTDLSEPELAHLERLMASWGMLADLCFADLLLFVPAQGQGSGQFVVLGQMRPTTGQTLHRQDLVGNLIDEAERPLVARAWHLGQLVEGETTTAGRTERARMQCIPVRWNGRLLAVLTREAPLTVGRRTGELERVYVEIFDRFAQMIVRGEFPFVGDEAEISEAPRVGDGVLVLDAGGRIEYTSPNAVSALHRVGIHGNAEGATLQELGVGETAVARAFLTAVAVTEEIESRAEVTVLVQCLPLLHNGVVSGALVLLQDVTALRRRDRLLVSKDATIREVHHRVKNNLQTISSLLRLRGRRLEPGPGKDALEDVEREIRSIAVVHEILSREVTEQVPSAEILRSLVRMAEDTARSLGKVVTFSTVGDAGELPAQVVTPLAVVLNELLQNAVEHAFNDDDGAAEPDGGDNRIDVRVDREGGDLVVQVRDNGRGLPDGFSLERTASIGLSIVREMVRSQLGGELAMVNARGALVELRVPVAPPE
ncbi:MAG TPA: histidine kinase N-terminal domain-containing protein [Acidimicrobiales bacterium]